MQLFPSKLMIERFVRKECRLKHFRIFMKNSINWIVAKSQLFIVHKGDLWATDELWWRNFGHRLFSFFRRHIKLMKFAWATAPFDKQKAWAHDKSTNRSNKNRRKILCSMQFCNFTSVPALQFHLFSFTL